MQINDIKNNFHTLDESVFFIGKMKNIFMKHLIKPLLLLYNNKKENNFHKTAITLILKREKKIYFKGGCYEILNWTRYWNK